MTNILKVVSCTCDPEAAPTQAALQFDPAGFFRVPGELDADIVGYYPLGAAGGDDISGRDNHATPALDEPAGLMHGILCEQAEVMDGRQSFALPFELLGSITVSLFIRPALSRLESTVLSVGDDIRIGLSFLLEPIIAINRGKSDETNITAARLPADKWCHLAFVYNMLGEGRIYVDGLPVALKRNGANTTRPRVPIVHNRGPAYISRWGERSGLIGAAQDVVIRTTALTGQEIAIERNSYCSPLLELA